MRHVYNDGGRREAGYQGSAGDCFCRALAIAAEMPYQQAYDLINKHCSRERRRKGRSDARSGVHKRPIQWVMQSLGWSWTPTMFIGQGCKVHLRDGELPGGRLVVSVSRHMVAVIDGVIHDTHDCSRHGTRCVYGYWQRGAQ